MIDPRPEGGGGVLLGYPRPSIREGEVCAERCFRLRKLLIRKRSIECLAELPARSFSLKNAARLNTETLCSS